MNTLLAAANAPSVVGAPSNPVSGAATGEAIVGLLSPDYYFGYLESAIDAGVDKVRGK